MAVSLAHLMQPAVQLRRNREMSKQKLHGAVFAALTAVAAAFSHPVHAASHSHQPLVRIANKVNIPVVFNRETYVREMDDIHSELTKKVEKYQEGVMIGTGSNGEAEVEIDGTIYYVAPEAIAYDEAQKKELLAQKEAEEKQRQAEEAERKRQEEEAAKAAAEKERLAALNTWNGPKLSRSAGVNYGPSGKETYYNLPMNGVVSIMRSMGNTSEYWVREDGVKMLGDYVMVAAHLGLHPRGSLVPTSLGMGIVCDTGGFASSNPTQLDIATAW